ncbi:MAG: bacterial transcriptional activator domain-containing protein [Chloroflexi bacterium]|nr:bacterial transcriptional activator domain-containing protein [Chloroflexota bacterium]
MLKFLLGCGGYQATTELLVETFWPEAEPEAGVHSVQMAVHALRRALRGFGPQGDNTAVLFRRGVYCLNPLLVIHHDIERLTSAYERGRSEMRAGRMDAATHAFEEARDWYRGPYLADSPYEEWADARRAALQDVHLSTLGHLTRAYVQANEWERAAECCGAILTVDVFREDVYRQLMRCHAALGRIADVRRTFRICEKHLREELQVDPEPETVLLYQELTGGRAALRAS